MLYAERKGADVGSTEGSETNMEGGCVARNPRLHKLSLLMRPLREREWTLRKREWMLAAQKEL